jgi:hypothetical protein
MERLKNIRLKNIALVILSLVVFAMILGDIYAKGYDAGYWEAIEEENIYNCELVATL